MSLLPTKQQLEFLKWEFGLFFHFGIRSFNPGHIDWDGLDMPIETFNPDKLDCEQWIRTAKEAGAKYTILTTKHHDGFALWPSKYTSYSVANTPWKNGKGDVVREYVDASRKYDMKVGLYYSPAQWGNHTVAFENAKEYDDYFINQISELLENYGKIDYLWFDGCGSEGHVYDFKRIIGEIHRLQPEILIFGYPNWSQGVRWIGNEDGYASFNNPLVVSKTDFSVLATEEEKLANAMFLPGECDCRIRATWFHDNNENTLKSLDELFGMYEMSVGHGSNFLLNIGPDNHGLLPEPDVKRLFELSERIKQSYGNPLDYGPIVSDGDTHTISHNALEGDWYQEPKHEYLSNCVMITEDITNGQAVTSFRINAHMPWYGDKKVTVFEGKTIGHKVYCRFGAVRAKRYDVEITGKSGDYKILDIKAFFVK